MILQQSHDPQVIMAEPIPSEIENQHISNFLPREVCVNQH